MDVPAYLARIGYSGDTSPNEDTLQELHRAHMLAVPFENLDIGAGRKIAINPEQMVRKIVGHKRGGFCYELNGAFAALLQAVGFNVTYFSGRIPRADGSFSPEFDHMVLCVHLEHRWIADVGFGDSFLEPLLMHPGLDQEQGTQVYRVVERSSPPQLPEEGRLWVERLEAEGEWKPLFTFTRYPRELHEFAAMCDFHQTSPDWHFMQNSICSLPTPEGRITLSGMKLVETRKGKKEERMLSGEKERKAVLLERFGIRF